MVTRQHLFHYRDLGFLDEGAQTRAVGQTNGTLLLFAEKEGRFALVRDSAQAYDATALALGGSPSTLATEYLLYALQQAGVLAAAAPGPARRWPRARAAARAFAGFMVNVAYRLRADRHPRDPDYSVLDLKAAWRGSTYVAETIKRRPKNLSPFY